HRSQSLRDIQTGDRDSRLPRSDRYLRKRRGRKRERCDQSGRKPNHVCLLLSMLILLARSLVRGSPIALNTIAEPRTNGCSGMNFKEQGPLARTEKVETFSLPTKW